MIFRYIDGICRPLDMDNECSESKKCFSKLSDQNYCRPTKCPKCNLKVFFIRHNGGSVWMDSLGYPWPKHACFDKSKYRNIDKGYKDIDILLSTVDKDDILYLGLIIEIDVNEFDTKIIIRCDDNIIRYYLLSGKQDCLLGQIVTLKRNNSNIILSTNINNSIQNYEIPLSIIPTEFDLPTNNNQNQKVSKNFKIINKINNQKTELNKLGVKYSDKMASNELKELLKKETERRRNLNKSQLIEKLNEDHIHLTGNENYKNLKILKNKHKYKKKV